METEHPNTLEMQGIDEHLLPPAPGIQSTELQQLVRRLGYLGSQRGQEKSFFSWLVCLGLGFVFFFFKWRFGVGFKHWTSSKAAPLKSGLGHLGLGAVG